MDKSNEKFFDSLKFINAKVKKEEGLTHKEAFEALMAAHAAAALNGLHDEVDEAREMLEGMIQEVMQEAYELGFDAAKKAAMQIIIKEALNAKKKK